MEHSRLLKKPGNGPKRHTGRDEVEIRYPVKYCLFWIPDSRFAPSGMTSHGWKAAPTETTVGGHVACPTQIAEPGMNLSHSMLFTS